MKIFKIGLIIIFILLPVFLITQEKDRGINWYADEAETAIDKENFEYAVKILKEGIKLYPDNADLNIKLADLYYDKKLYQLSLNEYLAANRKEPDVFNTLDRIQNCYGYLNENEMSIKYLKRILDVYPLEKNSDSYYAVHDLGWMYYKTHRLEAGETLILESLAQSKDRQTNRSLHMTLATLYAGMYEYEKSRKYYLLAADEALADSDSYFAAICYYNLALLEYSFYNFNSAMQYTEKSLEQHDRPTGHLSRGELLQLQMNYKDALAEYEKGQESDESPLTRINMAILFNKFGLLEAARQYAENVYSSADLSWILNFGTDKDRHLMEMHRILADVYEGLSRREKLLPQPHILADIQAFFRSLWYGLTSYYHKQLYRSYSIKVGKAYLKEQNLLDAWWQFYLANDAYRDVALKYLLKARELETAVAPRAQIYYRQEEGKIRKSPQHLESTLTRFDSFWEKESIFDSLMLLIPLRAKATAERRELLNRAYAINPGGLFAGGYGIPLQLEMNFTGKAAGLRNRIAGLLEKAGSEIMPAGEQNPVDTGFRYSLTLYWLGDENPGFFLDDSLTGSTVASGTVDTGTGSWNDRCVRFIRSLLVEHLYVPRK